MFKQEKYWCIHLIVAFCYIVLLYSCNSPTAEDEFLQKMIPDHTPYISGLVEATNDTVHHFPEVVIGYMTDVVWDTHNWHHPDMLDGYQGLYNPTLWTQVVGTSQYCGFGYQAESKAKVSVTGPLNQTKQEKVQYTSLGNGVYGDKNYQLDLEAGERYRLDVTLPDQRRYVATTIIPNEVSVNIPDSTSIKVKYDPYSDGTPYEECIKRYNITVPYPSQEFLTVNQWNSSVDRQLLLLKPDEQFLFSDRSPYLRDGFYGIAMTNYQQDTLSLYWGQDLNKSQKKVWNKQVFWLRFSFFSKGLGHMFHPISTIFSLRGDEYDNIIDNPFDKSLRKRDTTYIFDVSTLRKVNAEGKVMPKDSLDAMGFFGGYFSIYRKMTMYPIRTFDLDSVLTAWDSNH